MNLSLTGDCGALQFASLPQLKAPDQLQLNVLHERDAICVVASYIS